MGKITICLSPDGSEYVALDENQAVIARQDYALRSEVRKSLIDSVWANKLYKERYPEGYEIIDWIGGETSHD